MASPVIGDVDVNGINKFITSPGPNAGGVAFSVLFHNFTPFLFRRVSAQEVAEAVFCIKSEAIGLDHLTTTSQILSIFALFTTYFGRTGS
jgi:hypothetical protein